MNNSSRYKLVEAQLNDLLYESDTFKDRLLNKFFKFIDKHGTLRYSFMVPAAMYLRGEMLCEDFSELSEKVFTQADLLNFLFEEFLFKIRSISNYHAIYSDLVARDNRPILLKEYTGNQQLLQRTDANQLVEFSCVFKRKQVLRLEICLADLAELYPEKTYSVEDVLQILYIDFITAYKNGELKDVMKRIAEDLD